MHHTAAELLAAADLSRQAAGRGDRAEWVGLFAADGWVADPVGSTPHIGHAKIGRFFDTFIGPRQISFSTGIDLVSGSTVVRDLTLEVQMGSAVSMAIPAILRYELDGELKIISLQAYWELPPMVLQFVRNGRAALPAGIGLTRALLANQGLSGAAGFLRGLRRPGRRERAQLTQLLTAFARGDELAARRLVPRSDGHPVASAELGVRLRDSSWHKVIGAGRSLAVSIHAPAGRSVVIAEFGTGATIQRLNFFG